MNSAPNSYVTIRVDRQRIELLTQALFTHLDLIMTSETLGVKDRVDRVIAGWALVAALKNADQMITDQINRDNDHGPKSHNIHCGT